MDPNYHQGGYPPWSYPYMGANPWDGRTMYPGPASGQHFCGYGTSGRPFPSTNPAMPMGGPTGMWVGWPGVEDKDKDREGKEKGKEGEGGANGSSPYSFRRDKHVHWADGLHEPGEKDKGDGEATTAGNKKPPSPPNKEVIIERFGEARVAVHVEDNNNNNADGATTPRTTTFRVSAARMRGQAARWVDLVRERRRRGGGSESIDVTVGDAAAVEAMCRVLNVLHRRRVDLNVDRVGGRQRGGGSSDDGNSSGSGGGGNSSINSFKREVERIFSGGSDYDNHNHDNDNDDDDDIDSDDDDEDNDDNGIILPGAVIGFAVYFACYLGCQSALAPKLSRWTGTIKQIEADALLVSSGGSGSARGSSGGGISMGTSGSGTVTGGALLYLLYAGRECRDRELFALATRTILQRWYVDGSGRFREGGTGVGVSAALRRMPERMATTVARDLASIKSQRDQVIETIVQRSRESFRNN